MMHWLELCTTYTCISPVNTTTSIIVCCNKHWLSQVYVENGCYTNRERFLSTCFVFDRIDFQICCEPKICVRSVEVIETDMYRSANYDFQLMFHVKHRPISHHAWGNWWFQSIRIKFNNAVYLVPRSSQGSCWNWLQEEGLSSAIIGWVRDILFASLWICSAFHIEALVFRSFR